MICFKLAISIRAEFFFNSILLTVMLHKRFRQAIDIFRSPSERRDFNLTDIQSVKKILPELSFIDQLLQRYIVCADHPYVHVSCLRSAHTVKGVFLKHAQKLRLHGQRQGTDFVKEKRSVVGNFEVAFLSGTCCAGKRAFLITEKFRLSEIFLNRRAVYFNTRLRLSRAVLMYQVENSFFADACLSLNNHIAVVPCYV